ncbi:hypothetical protein, partial [Roseomonas rosulenta]|uniref:hypothetical protein n=1 Tax=Roseomonas rosulenta TaxID=2748667 RepID=UPI001E64C74C
MRHDAAARMNEALTRRDRGVEAMARHGQAMDRAAARRGGCVALLLAPCLALPALAQRAPDPARPHAA